MSRRILFAKQGGQFSLRGRICSIAVVFELSSLFYTVTINQNATISNHFTAVSEKDNFSNLIIVPPCRIEIEKFNFHKLVKVSIFDHCESPPKKISDQVVSNAAAAGLGDIRYLWENFWPLATILVLT